MSMDEISDSRLYGLNDSLRQTAGTAGLFRPAAGDGNIEFVLIRLIFTA